MTDLLRPRRRRHPRPLRLPLRRAAQAGDLLMTANGFLQVGLYLVVLLALAKPLGGYMARVYEGEPTFARSACCGPLERLIYRLCGVDPDEEMSWKTYAVAMLLFNALGMLAVYGAPAPAGRAAAEPAGLRRRHAGLVVQHRGQLRHQHQLAGLRRRSDDELPHPDAGADGAELRLRRHRHGGAGRADPRLPRVKHARRSATSGSISPAARSTSCCRSRSSSRSCWSRRASCRPSAPTGPCRCCSRPRSRRR